jgi:hypothetical protein
VTNQEDNVGDFLARRLAATLVLTMGSVVALQATASSQAGTGGILNWATPVLVDTGPHVSAHWFNGISCPSATVCVAVDRTGRVVTSTDATADAPEWVTTDVDGTTPIDAISCPSAQLCVAVDSDGNVLTSRAPTAGASAWATANVDPNPDVEAGYALDAISCPSITLCGSWAFRRVDDRHQIAGISCPSTTLCVAVDSAGYVIVGGRQPLAPALWSPLGEGQFAVVSAHQTSW